MHFFGNYVHLLINAYILFQIHDIIACKNVIDFYADVKKDNVFQLLKKKWNILIEMDNILSIPFKATIELQKQSLILSDVFGIWVKMKLHLKAIVSAKKNYQTKLANYLLSALGERYDAHFSNPFMSSALFLDPRYRSQIMNDECKMNEAKATLMNVWRRLIVLKSAVPTDAAASEPINVSNTSTSSEPSFEFNSDEEMDKYLKGAAQNQSNVQLQMEQAEGDIEMLLDLFDPPLANPKTDVLEFWENEKEKNESLHTLAMVVFAIPPTEVQIERDFSKLSFVFNKLRCKLTEERLEDIMIINLNSDIFFDVKKEQIIELKTKQN